MKKYKVGVCGNFDTEANGQSLKTRYLWKKITESFESDAICRLDTCDFKRSPVGFLFGFVKMVKECESVVMLPAKNALKLLATVGIPLKKKYHTKVYYLVVGAWLGKYLKEKKFLCRKIESLDGIFPETETLRRELEELGLKRIQTIPNFKMVHAISEEELVYQKKKPFKICYFSRVLGQKGIEELIDTLKNINKKDVIYELDIYGPIVAEYAERFGVVLASFPDYIRYKGIIESDEAAQVIKDYYLQVFPTKFRTEGIPGSIIDSYNAGVPVISARWNSCYDIIDEGITGITYEIGNYEELEKVLLEASENEGKINGMKVECLKKAKFFDADSAMKTLLSRMEEEA